MVSAERVDYVAAVAEERASHAANAPSPGNERGRA